MQIQDSTQFDPRSVAELVNAVLTETDEDISWYAVAALHWRGTREVLNWAESLCRSVCSRERCLGADILGQLGIPDRTFPNESFELLLRLLNSEKDANVLKAIFMAFGHLSNRRVIPIAARYVGHPEPLVRYGIVHSLLGFEDQPAINLLIELTTDVDSNVRDWATFGLGTLLELDTLVIRNALVGRLNDSDDDTRGEALVGLARRKDRRVLPSLLKELESDEVGTLAVEAAELMASTELYSHLVALREWWGVSPYALDQAIAACQL